MTSSISPNNFSSAAKITQRNRSVPRVKKGSGLQLGGLSEQGDGWMDALLQSAPHTPSLQLQLLWKPEAFALWGFILIIATGRETVLTNVYFNNILHLFSIFALKISEVLNRRQKIISSFSSGEAEAGL